jgi:hypothetical protein
MPVEQAANCAECWRSPRKQPMGMNSSGEKDHNRVEMSCREMLQRVPPKGNGGC